MLFMEFSNFVWKFPWGNWKIFFTRKEILSPTYYIYFISNNQQKYMTMDISNSILKLHICYYWISPIIAYKRLYAMSPIANTQNWLVEESAQKMGIKASWRKEKGVPKFLHILSKTQRNPTIFRHLITSLIFATCLKI